MWPSTHGDGPQAGSLVRGGGPPAPMSRSYPRWLGKGGSLIADWAHRVRLHMRDRPKRLSVLTGGQLYTAEYQFGSPQVKREFGRGRSRQTGALFVDVGSWRWSRQHRHKVPMSVSGAGARRSPDLLSPCGMDITYINGPGGKLLGDQDAAPALHQGAGVAVARALTGEPQGRVEREIMESIRETIEEQPFEQLGHLPSITRKR